MHRTRDRLLYAAQTWLRSAAGVYPFVAALKQLAADVKAILPFTKVVYSADWSEWFGHQPADGSGDVYFHLDPLWSVQGGEGYDWYYASLADRNAQIRTPITDGAYGKPWVFRYKDVKSWWRALRRRWAIPRPLPPGLCCSITPSSRPR
jgi:hypothetical protein